MHRVKSVQDFIDEVAKEQSLGANQILDMDGELLLLVSLIVDNNGGLTFTTLFTSVTLSECLLDIVTDLIAEEGGIGLHEVCKDADVDCNLLSRMMECHGVDEC